MDFATRITVRLVAAAVLLLALTCCAATGGAPPAPPVQKAPSAPVAVDPACTAERSSHVRAYLDGRLPVLSLSSNATVAASGSDAAGGGAATSFVDALERAVLLGAATGHSYVLPRELRDRQRVYCGRCARLRQLLASLADGSRPNLGVAVLGGSVAAGHSLNGGDATFLDLTVEWLRKAFPRATVSSKNLAKPGTQSRM